MPRNVVILSIIAGIVFRLFIISLIQQPFVFDQIQYRDFARHIIEKGIHADTYRLYGFPLVMAPFVYFTDVEVQKFPWIIFQAVLDTATAFLVFFIARKIFSDGQMPLVSFFLYLFNPFTSAYAGVFLSEIVTIFLLTLILLLMLLWFEKKTFLISLLLSFLLGFLPQIRPVFLYFDIFLMILILCTFIRKHCVIVRKGCTRRYVPTWQSLRFNWSSHLREISRLSWIPPDGGDPPFTRNDELIHNVLIPVLLIFIFITPFFYNMAANRIYFDEITPFSVDNVLVREIYTSLFIERSLPTGIAPYYAWPPEVLRTWGTFSSWDKNERYWNTNLYKKAIFQIILDNPSEFILSRIRKMWYVWEKHYLYTYIPESKSRVVNSLVYGGNVILLICALEGLIVFLHKKAKGPFPQFGLLILLFFAYVTFIHIFSTSEERFSLPAYPLIFVFAGFFFAKIWRRFYCKIRNRNIA